MPRTRIHDADPPRKGPHVTFRPGADLEQLARPFVERHRLTESVAFKHLAALSLVGLDQRHYPLVAQMAAAFIGDNPFPRACVYLQAALAGAATARGGLVVVDEPRRSQVLFDVVSGYLAARGGTVSTDDLWFTPVVSAPTPQEGDDAALDGELVPPAPGTGSAPDIGEPVRRRVFSKKKEVGTDADRQTPRR